MRARHLFSPWFYLFILGSITLEVGWYLLIQRRAYPWRETVTSVGVYLLRLPVRFLAPAIVAPLSFLFWSWSPFHIPYDTTWGLMLLFLAEECAYYWMHRCSHEIRWLWASHVVHHTPEHLHLASAFRLGATELLSGNWIFHLPLYLMGFNPVAVGAMAAINLSYQFLLHTEAVGKLGPPGMGAQYPVPSPGAPCLESRVPGPELRRHDHHLGPVVRDLRRRTPRDGPGLRPSPSIPQRQPPAGRLPGMVLIGGGRSARPFLV